MGRCVNDGSVFVVARWPPKLRPRASRSTPRINTKPAGHHGACGLPVGGLNSFSVPLRRVDRAGMTEDA